MASVFFGHNPPFLSGPSVLPVQADERLIKNDLLQLLLTVPGERVMRPDYGTPLRTFVFEPGDSLAIDTLEADVLAAIDEFESRVLVIASNFDPDLDRNTLNIRLDLELKNNDDSIRAFILELQTPLDIGAQ